MRGLDVVTLLPGHQNLNRMASNTSDIVLFFHAPPRRPGFIQTPMPSPYSVRF